MRLAEPFTGVQAVEPAISFASADLQITSFCARPDFVIGWYNNKAKSSIGGVFRCP